ncbi:hypothetical protein JCM8202v2_003131 [Rhodotorula sphaerocarpa]
MTTPDVPAMRAGKRAPPKLDLSAFAAPPSSSSGPETRRTYPNGILDAHVHLWTREQLESGEMDWQAGLRQLSGPHEMEDYRRVVEGGIKLVGGGESKHAGFVYVQAQARFDEDERDGSRGGWDAALNEVEKYGDSQIPIKAFRFLLQDCPPGFFHTEAFVDGFRYLGQRGYGFDMTLDVTHEQTGRTKILEDALVAIERTMREGQESGARTHFILDHFAKPPLTTDVSHPPRPSYGPYLDGLFQLALLPHTYLKLSALLDSTDRMTAQAAFAEFKNGDYKKRRREGAYERLKARVLSVLEPAIEAFGDERILVGSDWPMFRATLLREDVVSPSPAHCAAADEAEEAAAWAFEMQLYLDCLVQLGLDGDAIDRIFERNARQAYNLQ